VKKWMAARRAQYALKQKFDRIDFEEDVLLPEAEALLSGKVKLEIEAGADNAAQSIISITVDDQTEEDEEEVDALLADGEEDFVYPPGEGDGPPSEDELPLIDPEDE
jgi:hypothetical protein